MAKMRCAIKHQGYINALDYRLNEEVSARRLKNPAEIERLKNELKRDYFKAEMELKREYKRRKEQESLKRCERFETPKQEMFPMNDMFFLGARNDIFGDVSKHEPITILSVAERERLRMDIREKGFDLVFKEKLADMRKSGKFTALGAFGHAKYLLECELREEQEILKKEGSDETIRVSSEKRNKLAEIASARLKARRELEQARKKIQRKREEEKGI